MTSLAPPPIRCASRTAMSTLAAPEHFRCRGQWGLLYVSSAPLPRRTALLLSLKILGTSEWERGGGWGCEGGILPELKMAAASAAPRNFTSGLGAAGAAGLASAAPYGVGVRLGGAAWSQLLEKCPQGGGPRRPFCRPAVFVKEKTQAGVCPATRPVPSRRGPSGWTVR